MITTCVNHLTVTGRALSVRRFLNMTTRKQEEGYLTGIGSLEPKNARYSKRFFSLNSFVVMPERIWKLPMETSVPRHIKMQLGSVTVEKQTTCRKDWCLRNWGCPYDVVEQKISRKDMGCRFDLKDDTGYLSFSFETINTPPVKWLDAAIAQFPELTFILHYELRGQLAHGYALGLDGELWESEILTEPADIFDPPEPVISKNEEKPNMDTSVYRKDPFYGDLPF